MSTLKTPRRLLMALRKTLQRVIICAVSAALPAVAAAQDSATDHANTPTPRAAATATAAAPSPSEQGAALQDRFNKLQRRIREIQDANSPNSNALAADIAALERARKERSALLAKKKEVLEEYNARIRAVESQGGTDDDKLWLAAQAASVNETAESSLADLDRYINTLKRRRDTLEAVINRERLLSTLPDGIVPPTLCDPNNPTICDSNLDLTVGPTPEVLSDADRARALDYLKTLGTP